MLIISRGSHITEIELVKRLYEAGVDLVFISDLSSQDKGKLEKWKVPTIPLTFHSRFDWAGIKTLRKMILKEGFGIVHTLANRPLTNSLWAAYGTGVKLVSYRGAIGHVHRWDPGSWLKWLNPRVDRVVCVSDAVKEDLLSAGVKAEKLLRIYKGHDLKWYENLVKVDLGEFGIPPGAFVVGCTANMRRVKGVDVLVRAAHFLPEASPVHFLLIGEVRDPLIKKLANDPRISHRIHFAGYQREAPAIIGQCHIAAMPSRGREGLTKAIIEAMAQEVPAVVTDAGGLRELVVDGECGFVVRPDDPEAIAVSISRLFRDADLRKLFGESAKKRIAEHFNIERTVRETIALYENLVASKQHVPRQVS